MFRILALSLSIMIAAGCAIAPTSIESTWLDETFDGPPLERVAVLALFDTVAESRGFETRAVEILERHGVQATAGYTFLAPDIRYSQEDMERELRGADVDALLIFRLIAIDERRVYRPPTAYMAPLPPGVVWGDPYYWYYYPHWNYYWHWRSSLDVTRSPGYWSEYTYVTVETSLYDNASDRLVWTAKSETIDDVDFDRLAGSVAEEITRELVDLELLDTSREALAAETDAGDRSAAVGQAD